MMSEVKFLVIDDNGRDQFVEVMDALDAANREAESQWDKLTKKEKAMRHIYVLDVTSEDLSEDAVDEDGHIDWTAYDQGGSCSGRFDTKNIPEI